MTPTHSIALTPDFTPQPPGQTYQFRVTNENQAEKAGRKLAAPDQTWREPTG